MAVPQWVLFRVSSPFLLLFRRRKEPRFRRIPARPSLSADMGKAGSSGPAVLQPRVRATKADCAANGDLVDAQRTHQDL